MERMVHMILQVIIITSDQFFRLFLCPVLCQKTQRQIRSWTVKPDRETSLYLYTAEINPSPGNESSNFFFLWKNNEMTLPTTFRVMRAHSYCPAFLTLHMYFPASLDCRDMICKDASPARKLDVKETRPFCSSFRSS